MIKNRLHARFRYTAFLSGCLFLVWLLPQKGFADAGKTPVCVASQYPDLIDCPAIHALSERPEPLIGIVFDVIENNPDALDRMQAQLAVLIEQLQSQYPQLPVEIVSHGNELARFAASGREQNPFLDWSQTQMVDVVGCRFYADMRGMDLDLLEQNIRMTDYATRYLSQRAEEGYAIIRLRPTPGLETGDGLAP